MACVAGWHHWANLPENNFYHINNNDFIPQRGDILLYNDVIPLEYKGRNTKPPYIREHIGIVLELNDGTLKVAEGNIDNRNTGGITYRDKVNNIDGFIRITDDYKYESWRYPYVGKL